MGKIKSGSAWVSWADAHAKNSRNVDDLAEPFRTGAKEFITALEHAGAVVATSTTRRSDKRAYLFHWCWKIGLGKVSASAAATMSGIDIEWDHGDVQQSIRGAKEMITGFGLAVPPNSINAPSLASNHIAGKAVDMDITWTGILSVPNKDGTVASVVFMTDVNQNTSLHAVGASYGVLKLATDAPHWSFDGR